MQPARTEVLKDEQQEYSLSTTNISATDGGEIVKWSPSMQSLLEEVPSSFPFRLVVGGALFCVALMTWAWFGKIDKVGKAHGKLIPEGETYKIESLESAKISEISVREGEEIRAGQLLASLDSEREIKEIERLKEILDADRNELSQKQNLLEKAKMESETHKLMARAEVRSQNLAIESASLRVQDISDLLPRKQSELQAYLARQNKSKQLSSLDQEKSAQINTELEEHKKRLQRLRKLVEEGAISQEFVFQAEQNLRQVEQQLLDSKLQGVGNIGEQIFQSEQSLRQIKTGIAENKSELSVARKELEGLQSDLEHKKAENSQIQIASQQKVQQIELEIHQAKNKIAETKNRLAIAKRSLEKRMLRSPVAGTVLAFNVVNTGKVVQSGETVAEVAPTNSPLVLSAVIPDRDAGFIEKGMTAQVKFDAYSYQDYGVIPGKVIEISANTQNDESLGAVYRVKIELERDHISEDSKKVLFKPGQTATADIVIRRLRIIDVILDPIKKLQHDGINL